MTLQPLNLAELREKLASANSRGEKVESISLDRFDRVLEHTPEDMTVTVEAGLTLDSLERQLAQKGQWLAIDPPNPQKLSIGALLAADWSGPRRFGFGTIRDYLIGLKVVLADGRLIKSGGKVVKNVAGYDLQKVFVGSRGSLGVMVEATFKLRPLPEAERFVGAPCESLQMANALLESVVESEVTPSVLDLHRLAPSSAGSWVVVAGFSGSGEEVLWQLDQVTALGLREAATLDYEKSFWAAPGKINRISVLPSRMVEKLDALGNVPFIVRAGNGVIFFRGPAPAPQGGLPVALMRRLKNEFDPRNILPEMSW